METKDVQLQSKNELISVQNRRQKVFNRGALGLCRGIDTIKIGKNKGFIVFHASTWGGLELFLGA